MYFPQCYKVRCGWGGTGKWARARSRMWPWWQVFNFQNFQFLEFSILEFSFFIMWSWWQVDMLSLSSFCTASCSRKTCFQRIIQFMCPTIVFFITFQCYIFWEGNTNSFNHTILAFIWRILQGFVTSHFGTASMCINSMICNNQTFAGLRHMSEWVKCWLVKNRRKCSIIFLFNGS